ncbi:MAG TPA: hypothetical protein VHJ38_19085 [Nitrososphaeraceae archaeon]|nr:hypothetical protein [Nitrososphaeraceae archaeon]
MLNTANNKDAKMYQMKSLIIIQKHIIVIWKFLSSSDQQQQQNRGIAGLGEYIRNLNQSFLYVLFNHL